MRRAKSSLWPICGTPPVWDCSGYRRSDRCASRSPSRSGAGPKTTSRGYNSLSAPDSEEPFEAANMKLQTILLSAALLIAATPAAAQDKYDIIFQDAVFASPRIDITDKVIKALEGKPPAK